MSGFDFSSPPTLLRQHSSPLPAQGHEESMYLEEQGLLLRHGSSLRLITQGTAILNEIFQSDPEKDFALWLDRGEDGGMQPYYFQLEDPALDGEQAVKVVLRAVMDGCTAESTPRILPLQPRIIIDYLFTPVIHRNRGLATLLVKTALTIAQMYGANCYVLAIEESVPYWMGVGFVEEEGPELQARLNIFSDTYLLRLFSDAVDPGQASDLTLAVGKGKGGDSGGSESDSGSDDGEDEGGGGEGEGDEEDQLRRALQASLYDR